MASIPTTNNPNSTNATTALPSSATTAASPVHPTAATPTPTTTTTAAATTTATGTKSKSKAKTVTKAAGAAGTQAKVKKPARKKTTTSKTTSALAAQTAWNNAKAAQADLARQKAQMEARRMDPLWYRIEDILPGDTNVYASTVLPEQAQIVEQVLATYGLGPADVTPQAMTCLLEQSRRFANEIISHAQDFAFAANRSDVLEKDLQLAAKMRPDFRMAVSAQIPKLNQIAQQINRVPLPPIPSHCYSGVLLPPQPHQLTARTYDIVSGARVQRKMIHKVPQAPKKKKTSMPAAASQPSYGASKGRPIPIVLKTTTPTVAATTPTTATTPSSPAAPIAMDVSPTQTPQQQSPSQPQMEQQSESKSESLNTALSPPASMDHDQIMTDATSPSNNPEISIATTAAAQQPETATTPGVTNVNLETDGEGLDLMAPVGSSEVINTIKTTTIATSSSSNEPVTSHTNQSHNANSEEGNPLTVSTNLSTIESSGNEPQVDDALNSTTSDVPSGNPTDQNGTNTSLVTSDNSQQPTQQNDENTETNPSTINDSPTIPTSTGIENADAEKEQQQEEH